MQGHRPNRPDGRTGRLARLGPSLRNCLKPALLPEAEVVPFPTGSAAQLSQPACAGAPGFAEGTYLGR